MFTLYYTNVIEAETVAAELRCCGFTVTITYNDGTYELNCKES